MVWTKRLNGTSQLCPNPTFAVGFRPGLSLVLVCFRLRFGNCDASRRLTWCHVILQMREIAEIELAIQGGTEKIEVYGPSHSLLLCL